MAKFFDILIVGSGHSGTRAAIALRERSFEGSIAIVSDERDLPYERPPLSKDYLGGTRSFERILIRPLDFWTGQRIALLRGERVTSVDARGHVVRTEQGLVIAYGKLIWAAGGRARRLTCPGWSLAGVHTIRTRANVDALASELPRVTRVVVVGGGYMGLEAAAVLAESGRRITVVEAEDRLLARVTGVPISNFYEDEHRARGVDIRLGSAVVEIVGTEGRVTAVRLDDGTSIRCDMVIVAIGIVPAVEPLIEAGAEGGDGVRVDPFCATSLPNVHAIGDCALHANRFGGGVEIRLESVQNAVGMADALALSLSGKATEYGALPWFWSKQYDLKLQTLGLCRGCDTTLVRGNPSTRSFSVLYLRDGRVIAIDCINAVRDYVQARALVAGDRSPDLKRLGDVSVALEAA